jgi:neutral ceramidase
MHHWTTALFSLTLVAGIVPAREASAAGWRAGVAAAVITPTSPMLMAGYAHRPGPAQGTLHELKVKALALEDGAGTRSLLMTFDLVGIDRAVSQAICNRITEQLKIERQRIALLFSHTHTGPIVGSNLVASLGGLNDQQQSWVDQYATFLIERTVETATKAMDSLEDVDLSWGQGLATFAVNRRENIEADVPKLRTDGRLMGPLDHAVPVLAVRTRQGELKAIVCGYACHATVLDALQWSGDWPGFATTALEERYPGALAFYWCGCGGDQNPLPRRQVELAKAYGQEMCNAVAKVIEAPMRPLAAKLVAAYVEMPLAFANHDSLAELAAHAEGNSPPTKCARYLLKRFGPDFAPPSTYPYPIQTWRLGAELTWLMLGGEVVVDYALRLKHELGDDLWVAAYANDVMNYIPSRRIQREGGYEGHISTWMYGLHSDWSDSVEEMVISAAVEQVKQVKACDE